MYVSTISILCAADWFIRKIILSLIILIISLL